ncbi:outer membrane protein assembly factor BamD [Lichenibacterium ramalinae]|uniref:Outer membrane protein assembly factor BamD n=2 Tax=Lichenibacterium ramalinae TaxID=2316527 RepID=A0A4Q2R9R4_9HYPH|nr:outer membrane protein assembly factor BamD [Lichenibacterium ramalinae]RYB02887.1 outer membrane protein assembly factor BamD [Lichenibacterium ramalinae]
MMVSDRFRMAVRMVPVVALLAVPLAGCSALDTINPFGAGEKYETKILAETPATDIYDQGLARLQKKDGAGAAKKFAELDKQYPFSDWSRKGLMMQTYANYQAGDYDTAITTGKHFYQLYPNAPDAPYALYLQAMSYYQQIPDVSRDQENAAKALDLFQQIVTKYPSSEYVDDSKYKIQVTRDQLAGKEMSTGRFYLNRRNYTAAINRFREVLAKYQTTRHTEEALERLTEAYLALGITGEAQTAAAVLGHNFPDSPWYKDAFAKLQADGLEPNEDPTSWISRTYHKVVG